MMTAYGLIKLSAIAFYNRVLSPTKRAPFGIVCRVTAILVVIWTLVFILLIIFGCGAPVWANWGSPDARLHCPVSLTSKHIGLMISDLLIDVFIICLPIVPVSRSAMVRLSRGRIAYQSADLEASSYSQAKDWGDWHYASRSCVSELLSSRASPLSPC